jgi:O-antigen/teichoic acid export membrane protein
MGDLKDKAISGVKWNALGRFSTQGVNFIIGLILARLLSPSDYGVVGMVGIFFAIAQTFIDSGFGSALIRKNDCNDIDFSTAFYFNIIVSLACCVCLSLASPYIANFFKIPILKDVVRVMSLNMLIGSIAIVHSTKLTHSIDFKAQAKVGLLSAIISGSAGILMAYNGFGVWSLVFQNLTATIVRVFLLFVYTKWIPQWKFSKESFKYLFGFGSKILVSSLLHTIYNNMTTLIIGRVYTANDLGFYTRGQNLASFPSTNISGILQCVTYPVLSKIQDDSQHLIESYRKMISMTSIIIFFGMFLLAALAKPIVVSLLTDKWLEAVVYLQVFCFGYMFDHICSLNLNILYVKGYSNLVLRLEIIKKVISISMILVAIPFGPLAICLACTIYTQIAVIINTYYTGKLFDLGYIKQLKDIGKYILGSSISVIPAYCITFSSLPCVGQLIIGAGISSIMYLLLLRNDDYLRQLYVLVRKMFE